MTFYMEVHVHNLQLNLTLMLISGLGDHVFFFPLQFLCALILTKKLLQLLQWTRLSAVLLTVCQLRGANAFDLATTFLHCSRCLLTIGDISKLGGGVSETLF